jgi:hypothetical protein
MAFVAGPASAQQWKPNFKNPKDVFEVSGSTYAWEVHDEGIEGVLDNMQQMAGVNSVYLIALMHHEARPHRGTRVPHNPVRRTWMAEDSRVYWHPDLSLYGRIKPLRSEHDWLSGTDWLDLVVDACRKRHMKVGVEVSHTTIANQKLKSDAYADLIQRNVTGEPTGLWGGKYLPCFNHPDVSAYLVALFTDLAKNHDVDYVQTCMINFAFGDASKGGCFCDSCAKAAKQMGYDMAAMKEAFRNDPKAQPHLDRWNAFRRNSVTALYRKITDAVKKANPKVDFRLNHWTRGAKAGGLYIEDVAPLLGSIRLMSYEEQTGKPAELERKRTWIADTRAHVGKDLPMLAALGVRDKAYPELIRQGVGVAVAGGVQGITLGHYDGAAHSILRAVRNGLAEADVSGIRPIVGVEAEKMKLRGYASHFWAYERCVTTGGVASASHRFELESGNYDLKISYADQEGGDARLALFVGGKRLDSWKLDKQTECWSTRVVANVRLKKGDEIRIEGKADGKDGALVDFVEFISKQP